MTCCCTPTSGIGKFFGHFARRARRRYARRGLEPTQQQLVEGLRQAGFVDAGLLEIGCGVGYLHQQLLREGAARVLGIDISEGMLAQARKAAHEGGLTGRTDYRQGDFVELADTVVRTDVTVLDKVVCCYPDAAMLMALSLAKTNRVYALTYPRDRGFIRVGARALNFLLWVSRSDYRTYVHDPRRIEAWITDAGFRKRYQGQTAVWLTQVYVRE